MNVGFGMWGVGRSFVRDAAKLIVPLLVQVVGGSAECFDMFDVVVKFFVGLGSLSFEELSRGSGFGRAGVKHDGEGLLQCDHQVFGHTVEVFRHGVCQFFPDVLDVCGAVVVIQQCLGSGPGSLNVDMAVLKLVEEVVSDSFFSFGHIFPFDWEPKLWGGVGWWWFNVQWWEEH